MNKPTRKTVKAYAASLSQSEQNMLDVETLENVRVVSTVVRMSVQTSRGPMPVDCDGWNEFASVQITIKGGNKMQADMVTSLVDTVQARTGDSRSRVVARVVETVRANRYSTIVRD